MPDVFACPSCGARLAPGTTACDLCGQELDAPPEEVLATTPEDAAADAGNASGDGAGPDPQAGPFCHGCGWKNPLGANFCSRCGTRLQAATPAAAPMPVRSAPRSETSTALATGLGPRLALYVVAAVVLVGGLYLATVASQRSGDAPASFRPQVEDAPAASASPTPAATGDTPFAALPAESERQVQALEAEVGRLTGSAREAKRQELINLLIGLGRPDRAVEAAETAARDANTPEAWRRAGDLLYRWMEALPEAQRPTVAPRVVAAYDRVLATRPDDLDARTNLGWAAQYDASGNPMRAITETNEVLRRDSLHLGASYNRGWFLRAIGRLDQAVAQFEKVRRLAGPETPLGREAQMMIESVRQQASGAPTPGAGAPPEVP
ncbi:MAG TPA: tetratricopeptide repeat protein [Rhodothermales bacterium]|nr:tetratricopeptide repeat protein [Rhodothermales bacterium]